MPGNQEGMASPAQELSSEEPDAWRQSAISADKQPSDEASVRMPWGESQPKTCAGLEMILTMDKGKHGHCILVRKKNFVSPFGLLLRFVIREVFLFFVCLKHLKEKENRKELTNIQ